MPVQEYRQPSHLVHFAIRSMVAVNSKPDAIAQNKLIRFRSFAFTYDEEYP